MSVRLAIIILAFIDLAACGVEYTVDHPSPSNPLVVDTSTAPTEYSPLCEAYCMRGCIVETQANGMIERHIDAECAMMCETQGCT